MNKLLLEFKIKGIASNNEKFINKIMSIIENNISNIEFDVGSFAKDLNITPINLYRKINSVLGQPPAKLVRSVRLIYAAEILKESIHKNINVSEVAYEAGFSNHSHFSQLFKKRFGISPTEYAIRYSRIKYYTNKNLFNNQEIYLPL